MCLYSMATQQPGSPSAQNSSASADIETLLKLECITKGLARG
jgi:hypothetical protein